MLSSLLRPVALLRVHDLPKVQLISVDTGWHVKEEGCCCGLVHSFASSLLLLCRLKTVIGMGTGAGAYILTRFAVSFVELL